MASKGFKQEMPPAGGYNRIEWAKQVAPKRLGGFAQFGLFIGFTTGAWALFHFQKQRIKREDLEMRDARLAIMPLIEAERSRMYLKQVRVNRDEENELMKNVEGWKTGTLWGEPVYYNKRDRFNNPSPEEYFAHCNYWDKFYAIYDKMNH